jgi:hypothetical protein
MWNTIISPRPPTFFTAARRHRTARHMCARGRARARRRHRRRHRRGMMVVVVNPLARLVVSLLSAVIVLPPQTATIAAVTVPAAPAPPRPPPLLPVAAATAAAAAVAARPPAASSSSPPPPPPCAGPQDCGLAGECRAGACVCDAWATGPRCTVLNARPAITSRAFYRANSSSWGGSPVRSPDSRYHMYASSFINHW